jgi:hypothetical protein
MTQDTKAAPIGAQTQAEERTKCSCCEVTTIGGELGEAGYTLARGVVLCSFCKLLFPQIPVPTVDLSDLELLGAWGEFAEYLRQFHLGVSYRARLARVAFDDLTPDCLQAWLIGSAIESASERKAIALLWPLEARRRVLEAIEVAAVLSDDYDHCADLDTLRGIIERDDVYLVWVSWLAANAKNGKAPTQVTGHANCSQWASFGEGHIERAGNWAKSVAKSRIHAK